MVFCNAVTTKKDGCQNVQNDAEYCSVNVKSANVITYICISLNLGRLCILVLLKIEKRWLEFQTKKSKFSIVDPVKNSASVRPKKKTDFWYLNN